MNFLLEQMIERIRQSGLTAVSVGQPCAGHDTCPPTLVFTWAFHRRHLECNTAGWFDGAGSLRSRPSVLRPFLFFFGLAAAMTS